MTRPIPLTTPALTLPHGFFTRQGGVSTGPFASLNCGRRTADEQARVQQNRALAAAAIGADPARLMGVHQVHGTDVVRITASAPPSAANVAPAVADAMVTKQRGVALGIVTADCAPVLFADVGAGVIGAAHAGWRGAVAGVLEATITAMIAIGAGRPEIRAAIGPAIGPASYEVGTDLHDRVIARDLHDTRFFTPNGRAAHWLFDLPGYCRARLEAAGIGGVTVIAADTVREPERFFSNRRRNQTDHAPLGHQISLIMLPAR